MWRCSKNKAKLSRSTKDTVRVICRGLVQRGLHNDVGHPGRDRTDRLLRERFYWPCMGTYIERCIGNCDRCLRRKNSVHSRALVVNVHTTYSLELVCLEILTLKPCKEGIANILIITDQYTKFAMAIPTKNQTAKTTAEVFLNNFIIHTILFILLDTNKFTLRPRCKFWIWNY